MVVRTRLRSIVLPIALYLVLGVASGYLVWGASNGEHGLKAFLRPKLGRANFLQAGGVPIGSSTP